jgi:cytochrome c
MPRTGLSVAGALAGAAVAAAGAAAEGDPDSGAQHFRACAACHSLEPGRHLTGPSLAGIWGREAGTVEGFTRYSEALEAADVVWNAETMDRWLADPEGFVPGNLMTFPAIEDERVRADLVAYLEATTQPGQVAEARPPMGGMAPQMPDLKEVAPENRVTAIRYCGDTYHVTTADGETVPFWEFNLRFKTDASDLGPPEGSPALLPSGMMGDRAFVIFADPGEISPFIEKRC